MVKLHTMNLQPALLLQTWDLFEYSAQNNGVSVTLSFSLTLPFPSFLRGKKIYEILVKSVVHVGWGQDSWKTSGNWALCTLDKVFGLNYNKDR